MGLRDRGIFDQTFDVLFENPSFIVHLLFQAALWQCATFSIDMRTGPKAGRQQIGPQMVLLLAG